MSTAVLHGVPTTLDNVDRVPAPPPQVFERDYVRAGRPVILTGLWDHTTAARLCDPRGAVAAMGDVLLPITPNLLAEYMAGRHRPAARQVTLGHFYDLLSTEAWRDQMCLEHDTPDAVLDHLPLPPYVTTNPSGEGWLSQMFMASPGNSVHLHYDLDLRSVLMLQVFGRKRYVVIDACETRKLAPDPTPSMPYASGHYLQHFDRVELLDFLRYVNARDCILEPGEALLIPATSWHYVEYVDVALSVNFRLGRNEHLRFLAEAVPYTSVEVQALARCFRDDDAIGPAAAKAFARLVAAATRRYPSKAQHAEALEQLCLELCRRLDLPIASRPYSHADFVRRKRLSADAQPSGVASNPGGPRKARPTHRHQRRRVLRSR